MLNSLRQRVAGWIAGRSYIGASTGRRWSSRDQMPNPVQSASLSRSMLASRARWLVANAPLPAAGAAAWQTALVGTGLRPQPQHRSKATREKVTAAWESWTDRADADGVTDAYGMQASVAKGVVVSGEALVLMQTSPSGELRLRQIDAEQIDDSYSAKLSEGRQVLNGIEIDADGTRIAYHVFKERPGLTFGGIARERMRIDAADVLHVYRQDWPGMLRGVSWYSSILRQLNDHDGAMDAQLQRQRAGASFAGFLRSRADGLGPMAGATSSIGLGGEGRQGTVNGVLEPGTLKVLPETDDIVFSSPPAIGMDAIAFMRLTERELAAGLGLPGHLMHGAIDEGNFSNMRAALIAFHEKVDLLQHSIFVFQFLRRVYERWIALEVLSGRLRIRADDMPAPVWVTPKQTWVDPWRDSQAEVLLLQHGIKSRREIVASRGVSIETLDQERADDLAREKKLGLPSSAANQNNPPAADPGAVPAAAAA